jgi:6-phosphogluconolactonase (cycloisomerase 2 family)
MPVVNPSEGMTPFGFSFGHRSLLLVSEAFGGSPDAGAVSSYELLPDGTLYPDIRSMGTTETATCWLIATGNGRYAYTTNTGSNSVTGVEVGRDGSLGLLDADGATGMAGSAPIDAALSRNGRFLYTLNSGDGSLSAFVVGADGGLTSLAGVSGLPEGANGLAAQ